MARPKKTEAAPEAVTAIPENEELRSEAVSHEAVSDSTSETGEERLTLSKAELDALVASAVASALADVKPQIVKVKETEEPVVLLFLGGIAAGSTVALGELGSIYRDGGTLTVAKDVFFSKLNGVAEQLLRARKLIVVSGLNEEERERYGVNYGENELLNEKTYGRLLTYANGELAGIYSALCPEHKALAAKIFRSGIDAGDGRVTEAKLKLLAKIDRESGIERSPFRAMLDMISGTGEEDDA